MCSTGRWRLGKAAAGTAPSEVPPAPMDQFKPPASGGGEPEPAPSGTWTCELCTFHNHGDSGLCEMCTTTRRPHSSAPEPNTQMEISNRTLNKFVTKGMCPLGHQLMSGDVMPKQAGRFNCDFCRRFSPKMNPLESGSRIFSFRTCNFDVCAMLRGI